MQIFLERMQFEQAGRFSSHLMRRCLDDDGDSSGQHASTEARRVEQLVWGQTDLQLLHPVLTFGRLVLARFGLGLLVSSDVTVEMGDKTGVGEGTLLRNWLASGDMAK